MTSYPRTRPGFYEMSNSEKFAEKKIILLPHPVYTPGVAPRDFFQLGYMKDRIQGSQFKTSLQLLEAISYIIASVPKDTFNHDFKEGMHRVQVVVQNVGEYNCP